MIGNFHVRFFGELGGGDALKLTRQTTTRDTFSFMALRVSWICVYPASGLGGLRAWPARFND